MRRLKASRLIFLSTSSILIEVLRVIKEERVVFESNGAENPGVLRPENREDFIHVIMPMSK